MKIRLATLFDVPAIADLSMQLGYPTTSEQAALRLAEILEKPDHAVFIAETVDHMVVGWVHVIRTVLLEIDPFAEIGGLVVYSSYRSRGIGKILLEAAEAWARHNNLFNIWVRSNVIRSQAHHFYKDSGFVIIKSQHVFRKLLEE